MFHMNVPCGDGWRNAAQGKFCPAKTANAKAEPETLLQKKRRSRSAQGRLEAEAVNASNQKRADLMALRNTQRNCGAEIQRELRGADRAFCDDGKI